MLQRKVIAKERQGSDLTSGDFGRVGDLGDRFAKVSGSLMLLSPSSEGGLLEVAPNCSVGLRPTAGLLPVKSV